MPVDHVPGCIRSRDRRQFFLNGTRDNVMTGSTQKSAGQTLKEAAGVLPMPLDGLSYRLQKHSSARLHPSHFGRGRAVAVMCVGDHQVAIWICKIKALEVKSAN